MCNPLVALVRHGIQKIVRLPLSVSFAGAQCYVGRDLDFQSIVDLHWRKQPKNKLGFTSFSANLRPVLPIAKTCFKPS
ncbi:MAG: hypothetical protein AB7T07_12575 [Steroidobacteraceae bacterium]